MIYADYSYYKDIFQGNRITEDEWPACAREASAYVDNITYGRLKGHPERVSEDVKMAVCGAAEAVFAYNNAVSSHAPEIVSESVGGQSVSYLSPENVQSMKSKGMREAVNLYLPSGNPLRYAGVCGC